FPKLTVFHIARDPVDLFVVTQHVVFEFGNFNIPRRDGTVDQRGAATPAVRVGVLIGLFSQQRTLRAQGSNDSTVGFEDLHPGNVLQHTLTDGFITGEWKAFGTLIHGRDHGDTVSLIDSLVFFTIGRRLMDQAGAVLGRHIVISQDPERVLRAVGFSIDKVGEQWLIYQPGQLRTGVGGSNRGDSGIGVVIPQNLGMGSNPIGGQ